MTNSCSERKVKGASVWDWRPQYPDCVGRGAYCNASIICVQPQRLQHIEGKHSWPPECLQTVGLCFTLWPFNFWRNARRDVSVKIRSEESVTIGYHSPGGRAVGCPLFGESSLLTGCEGVALQMILRWQRACLLLRGGGHSQINATDFRHVWLTGMELNISALCADVDTTVDSSCLSPHNHESYENLKESLGFITFSKTDYCRGPLSAPCTFCFSNLRTAPPMTTSLNHPDESISLPSYGDTLFNSEK